MHSLMPFVLLTLWQACTTSASCVHNTHLHLRFTEEKDGNKVRVPNFGYNGDVGPTNWQAIDAGNMQCAAGLNQSPISIKAAEMPQVKAGDIKMEIPNEQEMLLENLGTNVEVLVEGTTTIGEKKFKLKQFHYHTPSEHRIDEEYFPVEVHMVHEAEGESKEIVVIGFLFQLTASPPQAYDPSSIFSNALTSISSIPTPGDSTPVPKLDMNTVTSAIPKMPFYSYSGSLTTPPCAEDVTFLIGVEPLSMPVDTFNALKKVVKFNSRFVQNRLGEQNLLSLSRTQMEEGTRKQNSEEDNGDGQIHINEEKADAKEKDFGVGPASGERIVVVVGNEGAKMEEPEQNLRLRKRRGGGRIQFRSAQTEEEQREEQEEQEEAEGEQEEQAEQEKPEQQEQEEEQPAKRTPMLEKRKGGKGGGGGGGGKGGSYAVAITGGGDEKENAASKSKSEVGGVLSVMTLLLCVLYR